MATHQAAPSLFGSAARSSEQQVDCLHGELIALVGFWPGMKAEESRYLTDL